MRISSLWEMPPSTPASSSNVLTKRTQVWSSEIRYLGEIQCESEIGFFLSQGPTFVWAQQAVCEKFFDVGKICGLFPASGSTENCFQVVLVLNKSNKKFY